MNLGTTPSSSTLLRGAAIAIVGIVISAAIYQPWHSTSFDIRDFSEFLPLLTHNPSIGARIRAFLVYYANQGRVNVLTYVSLVLRWELFGWDVAMWQWARFLEMWIVLALLFSLLRRVGATMEAAAAGAALYLASYPAQGGWLRLTAGEPLGTIFLLAAAHVAVGYDTSRRWRVAAGSITALICAAVLVKEMFVAALPFLLLAAGGRTAPSRWISVPRMRWLAGLVLVATVLTIAPMAVVALRAGGDRYASLYGTGGLGPGRLIAEFRILVLPISSTAPLSLSFTILPNVLYLWVLTRGWSEGLSTASVRGDRLRLLLLCGSLPVCAALVYFPWPVFSGFYAFPYFLSSAILFAMALTFLRDRAPRQAVVAGLATLVIVFASSLLASKEAQRSYAVHRMNADLAQLIGRSPQLDTVIVATRSLPFQNWQGTAATLVRFAAAVDSSSRPASGVDIECEKTLPLANAGGGRSLLVSYSDDCGTFRRPVKSFVQHFRYPAWPFFALRNDSVRADLISAQDLKN